MTNQKASKVENGSVNHDINTNANVRAYEGNCIFLYNRKRTGGRKQSLPHDCKQDNTVYQKKKKDNTDICIFCLYKHITNNHVHSKITIF